MVVPFPVPQDQPEPLRTSRLPALVRLVVIGPARNAQRREVVVDATSPASACTVTFLHDYRSRARSSS